MSFEVQQISDQIVKLTIQGDISDEEGEQFLKDMSSFRESIPPGKQLHYLVDAMKQGRLSAGTRSIFTEQNKSSRVGKIAIFGPNRFVRVMATFTLKASGRDNMRFFETESEALAWLQTVVEKETVA